MGETNPQSPMDEDIQHLEESVHRLAAIARTLARDVDAIEAGLWNEPYLESRWLVSPLSNERPSELDANQSTRRTPKKKSYPHVIPMGVSGE